MDGDLGPVALSEPSADAGSTSIWHRELRLPGTGGLLPLAWVMLLEAGVAVTLIATAIYEITAQARAFEQENFLTGPTIVLVIHFDWLRAAEYLVPIALVGGLFAWTGIVLLVFHRRATAPSGVSRLVVVMGCTAQPVVAIATLLWGWRASSHPQFFDGPDWNLRVYPGWVLYLLDAAGLLLWLGTVLWLAELRRRRLPWSTVPAVISATAIVALTWPPINAIEWQYSASAPRGQILPPLTVGFWSAGTALTGAPGEAAGAGCENDRECLAVATGAITRQSTLSTRFRWWSADFRNGTWGAGRPMNYTTPGGAAPASVSCTPASCVAVGSRTVFGKVPQLVAWHTEGGGPTWSPATTLASSADSLPGIRCNDVRCLVITGTTVFASDDGGATWRPFFTLPPTPAAPPAHGLVSFNFINSAGCATSLDCLVVGETAAQTPLVESTSDGGASWTKRPGPPGFGAMGAVRCAGLACYAIGFSVSGQAPVDLLETMDSGVGWTNDGAIPLVKVFRGLACPSSNTCVAVGEGTSGRALAVSTHDHGATWHAAPILGGVFVPDDVACLNASNCVSEGTASNRDVLLASTSDGGLTWHVQGFPPADDR
ncbi:MAG TPA: hypothetical protein VK277_17325 [Acidimicrobiales bacterium]|nr:hypothetical protein [Acidimicrobiales bacterium]